MGYFLLAMPVLVLLIAIGYMGYNFYKMLEPARQDDTQEHKR